MRKQLILLILVIASIVIQGYDSRLLIMGPYRGKIVIPEAGILALKRGNLIDMEASPGLVGAVMNGRDAVWLPGYIIGITQG